MEIMYRQSGRMSSIGMYIVQVWGLTAIQTAALTSSATSSPQVSSGSNVYYASVSSGYLALRNAMAYDVTNEIGKIANGQEVDVVDSSTGTYWYVYVPALNQYGYVNSNYLRR